MDAIEILATTTLWAAAVRIAAPYIFGTLGELICERAGVLNLGIEGIMTAGAFAGWYAVYSGGDLWTGVLVAALVGAAFGLLNAADFPFKGVVIPLIALAALGAVGLYSASLAHHQRAARIGLALIIGGAAGNLIDRVLAGSVVDFVDVYWRTYHFWAFNVADSAITVGVAIMILDVIGTSAHVSKTV